MIFVADDTISAAIDTVFVIINRPRSKNPTPRRPHSHSEIGCKDKKNYRLSKLAASFFASFFRKRTVTAPQPHCNRPRAARADPHIHIFIYSMVRPCARNVGEGAIEAAK